MEIQIRNGVETGRSVTYIWMTKQKQQSFILIMNLQFEQSLAQSGFPWGNLRLELSHMKAGFLTLVWRLTLANGSYLEYLHMVSHVFSPLHGMVTRFRKSACQEKLADAAWPFLIKPQKFHSITFAVL